MYESLYYPYIHDTGRAHEYAWMQTMRLDAARNAEGETFAETLEAPALVLPAPDAAEDTPGRGHRHRLASLLATLTERQRHVLTLRYGLDPADARTHSRTEIGRLLGLSPGSVYNVEQCAIATLRHACRVAGASEVDPAERQVPVPPRQRQPVSLAQRQYNQRRHSEQQARLEAAFQVMQEEGLSITSETLSAAAHVDHRAACVFVKAHCPHSAERARIRAIPVAQRLEEACADMVARGDSLSITNLKAAAHTDAPTVRAFLRSKGIPRQLEGLPRPGTQGDVR